MSREELGTGGEHRPVRSFGMMVFWKGEMVEGWIG
jgi:hypothetical protein